jgi:hypothetical protein
VLALGVEYLQGSTYADDKINVPVKDVAPVTDPLLPHQMPGFYELKLGEVPAPRPEGSVQQAPAATLWPCTFLVQVRSGHGLQGQTIVTP